MQRNYPEIAMHVPTLLLPKPGVPLASWSVIACDQHTSQPAYWQETRRLAGDNPSTLHLVLPEAELGSDADREAAIAAINERMREYAQSVLVALPPGFMLVERTLGKVARKGLVVALDLEQFDYRAGAQALIRSTEGTDRTRLPARTAVRRHALLETPHIMVLIDDPERSVIEPLFAEDRPSAYDFELMQGGGRLRGWHMADAETIAATAAAIAMLRRGEPPMAYAMGDGNHSFAAAKTVWEELKAEGAEAEHPGRYALVELVNVHDDALQFDAIHRLAAGVDPAALLAAMAEHFAAAGFERHAFASRDSWLAACRGKPAPGHRLPYITQDEYGLIVVAKPRSQLPTATLQHFLDEYLPGVAGAELDYIHGDDTLAELCTGPARIGFLLPAMNKHDLFATVAKDGATPRKTFSLGEAHEKRYYLECRRIQP